MAREEIEIPKGYEARIEGNKVIFEPKESEDERIRKDLITFICQFAPEHLKTEYVTYLEKQKEQKPAEWNDTDMREVRDNLISACEDWEHGMPVIFTAGVVARARYFLEHLTEPKPVKWSEEDEKKIVELKTFIAQCNGFNRKNKVKIFDMIDALRPSKTVLQRLNAREEKVNESAR